MAHPVIPLELRPDETFRILVTGSRNATEDHRHEIKVAIIEAVGRIRARQMSQVILVHGDEDTDNGCPGVDRLAESIVKTDLAAFNIQVEPHNARDFLPWPAAGPKRNSHMVSLGANICLGFALPGSKGTWDCAKKAADAGIPTIVRTLGAVADARL